jgi:hypothetical protein
MLGTPQRTQFEQGPLKPGQNGDGGKVLAISVASDPKAHEEAIRSQRLTRLGVAYFELQWLCGVSSSSAIAPPRAGRVERAR